LSDFGIIVSCNDKPMITRMKHERSTNERGTKHERSTNEARTKEELNQKHQLKAINPALEPNYL
jgi:hypothetical protein